MNSINTINCPQCGSKISFDIYELLAGRNFVCSCCNTALSLAKESHDILENTMKKYETLKQKQKGKK